MKTIFIVNPCAGKGKKLKKFLNMTSNLQNVDIYITKSVGDATDFVKEYCEKNGAARFIACGGDGTFSEVLNGAINFSKAQIGVIPMGTGNDFCRNFDKSNSFFDILMQAEGQCLKCDAIKYRTSFCGTEKVGYCANMFNIGFDCDVVDTTDTIKKKTIFKGPLAYFISILITLMKKKCQDLKIEIDGKERHNGKLLLTSIANGCYCGGGVKSNPLASVNDGFININIIKNVSHFRFISLLPYYINGTFLKKRGIDKIASSEKCRKITITPRSGKMRICVDGEIIDAEKTEFEIVHNAFSFVALSKTFVENAAYYIERKVVEV